MSELRGIRSYILQDETSRKERFAGCTRYNGLSSNVMLGVCGRPCLKLSLKGTPGNTKLQRGFEVRSEWSARGFHMSLCPFFCKSIFCLGPSRNILDRGQRSLMSDIVVSQ